MWAQGMVPGPGTDPPGPKPTRYLQGCLSQALTFLFHTEPAVPCYGKLRLPRVICDFQGVNVHGMAGFQNEPTSQFLANETLPSCSPPQALGFFEPLEELGCSGLSPS